MGVGVPLVLSLVPMEKGSQLRIPALDETRCGLLCCLFSLSILWHLAAAGPLTLMSWPNSSLPNCTLPGRLHVPGEDSGVEILFSPSPKQCYTKGGLVLKMKPVLFRTQNLKFIQIKDTTEHRVFKAMPRLLSRPRCRMWFVPSCKIFTFLY